MRHIKYLLLFLLLVTVVLPSIAEAEEKDCLFSSDFAASKLPAEISPLHKTRWMVEDGVLIGMPATAEQQQMNKEAGPSHFGLNAKMFVKSRFKDAVVEFDFRFDEEGSTAVFVSNAPGRSHLFSLSLSPEKTTLTRFQDKKLKGDKKEVLVEVPTRLTARKWHRVKVVMQGEAVMVSVNGKETLSVAHERFVGEKHNPNFRTAGARTIQLDNISIQKI